MIFNFINGIILSVNKSKIDMENIENSKKVMSNLNNVTSTEVSGKTDSNCSVLLTGSSSRVKLNPSLTRVVPFPTIRFIPISFP